MKRTNFTASILVLVLTAGVSFAQSTGGGSGNRIRGGGGQVQVNPDGSVDVTNPVNQSMLLNRALGWRCLVVQPPVSPPGQARVYNDCATQLLRISTNGGAYVTLGGTGAAGTGTVTSVGIGNLAPLFTVSPSAITTSGTFTFALNSQAASTFFAAPAGATGTPVFRGIVASDVPALDVSKITTGVFGNARGGTGLSSYIFGDTLFANGAGALSTLPGNTSSTRKFYSQTGNGTFSGVPEWNVLANTDLPSVNLATANVNGGIAGVLGTANGGTGLSTIGNANTLLGVNNIGNGYEFKTPIAGNNVSITHTAGGIRFDVNSILQTTTRAPDGSATVPSYSFTSETNSGLYRFGAGDHRYSILGNDVLGISAGTVSDFGGRFNVYGLNTDPLNYTRGALSVSTAAVTLAAESAGTGSANVDIIAQTKGSGYFRIPNQFMVLGNSLRLQGSNNIIDFYDLVSGSAARLITGISGALSFNADSGIARNAAGILEVNNGTAGILAALKVSQLTGNVIGNVTGTASGNELPLTFSNLFTRTGNAISVTGVLPNANTTATNLNTASTIVARDASGNFSASNITAALTGTASGNLPLTGGTLTGNVSAPSFTSTIATGTAPLTVASTTNVPNLNASLLNDLPSAVTAAINTIVARDAAGNINANRINGSSINNGVINGVTVNNSVSATTLTSTVATGTAPLTVTSTTPVANLTALPAAYDETGTQLAGARLIVISTVLVAGTKTITLSGNAVGTTLLCTASDRTAPNPVQVLVNTTTQMIVNGTGADGISIICVLR